MEESNAFLYVVFSMLLLWLAGKIVVYGQKYQLPTDPKKRKQYKLCKGLHVVDLDPTGIGILRGLIDKKDINSLAQFLAINHPTIVEIFDYLDLLKKQFASLLITTYADATEAEKITAINKVQLPKHKMRDPFLELEETELRNLIEYDRNRQQIIDEKLIHQFGGSLFMEYFIIYCHLSHEKPAIFHIPPDNKLRLLFETLVSTNMALQGDQIRLKDRLKLFHLAQLNQIAVNVNAKTLYQTKDEAISALSHNSKAENYFGKHYDIKDVFKLTPATIDQQGVEREWDVYKAYAKILCCLHPT